MASLVVAAGSLLSGCRHPSTVSRSVTEGGAPDGGETSTLAAILAAEDGRRGADIVESWRLSASPVVRRHAIRALARIGDPDPGTDSALLRALGDEDDGVVAWAAYGLGWTCKGKEDAHVKALAARAASFADRDRDRDAAHAPSRDTVDPTTAILRAVGRCGGTLAEGVLLGTLHADPTRMEETAYALGSLAGRRTLSDEAMGALLDEVQADPPRADAGAALFPIGRLDHLEGAWAPRITTAARTILSKPSPLRVFALRALEKTGPQAASELARVAGGGEFDPVERSEAARALGRLGPPGHDAAARALAHLLEDHAILSPEGLRTDAFNVLLAVVQAMDADAPKIADAALGPLAGLPVGVSDPPPVVRRVIALRCAAGHALARAAYDLEVLTKCDPSPDGSAGQLARLSSILKRSLVGDRLKAFRALSTSPHVKVREAVLEAISQHSELDEQARPLLVQGLGASEPGVVATAAEAIAQHPERALTLAASERRAALDPRAKPPTSRPAMDLPRDVAAALTQALARAWAEDLVETRVALLDAAIAVNLPQARDAATRGCSDANITVREHASKALRALGAPETECPLPPAKGGNPPAAAPLTHPVRVTFQIDGRALAIVFEPDLAPVAVGRFVELARSGFFRSIVVHRVVPGYVVQFGDPGGDGYGGSGTLLRCETSPVPFGPLDVGVALAGRDTGSSQLFVTLGRYPKLDGDYARVGRAVGDWGAVAEGDVITEAKVEQ